MDDDAALCEELLMDFLDGDDFLVDVNLILSTAESFLDAIFAAAVFDADDNGEGEDFLEDVKEEEVAVAVAAEAAVAVGAAAAAGGAATALSLFGAAD